MSYLIIIKDRFGKLRECDVNQELEKLFNGPTHPFQTLFSIRQDGCSMVVLKIRRRCSAPAHEEAYEAAVQTVYHHFNDRYHVSLPEVDKILFQLLVVKLQQKSIPR